MFVLWDTAEINGNHCFVTFEWISIVSGSRSTTLELNVKLIALTNTAGINGEIIFSRRQHSPGCRFNVFALKNPSDLEKIGIVCGDSCTF